MSSKREMPTPKKVKKYLQMKRLLQSGKITTRAVRFIAHAASVPFAGSAEKAREILNYRRLQQEPPQFSGARVVRPHPSWPPKFASCRVWKANPEVTDQKSQI